jgi:hypothetical protein
LLTEIAEEMASDPDEGAWLAERARELTLEASLAETVGSKAFIEHACARFPLPRGPRALMIEQISHRWIAEGAAAPDDAPLYRSDDRKTPHSLWSVLSERIAAMRLRVRLRTDPELMSIAACGDDLLIIRAGARLTARAALRITEHELGGHLLPRIQSKRQMDILRCGCAGSVDEEEGRALLLEQRAGLMDAGRLRELGVRHLACSFLRRGANFVDAVRYLIELGSPTETAVRAMLRAMRGGGLGREIVYLPAMQRLERAFAVTPELEQCFLAGRASLRYALAKHTALSAREAPPR